MLLPSHIWLDGTQHQKDAFCFVLPVLPLILHHWQKPTELFAILISRRPNDCISIVAMWIHSKRPLAFVTSAAWKASARMHFLQAGLFTSPGRTE
jgi:hypothetical protein